MASQYKSEFPAGIEVDEGIKKFFESFYLISDTEEKHELYSENFTPDATLVVGTKKVFGQDAILGLRKAMWERVAGRSHKPLKIFPFGNQADEVMLFGTVAYWLKDGTESEIDWAARAQLVNNGEAEGWKLKYYQVYLDSAAMAKST